VGFEIFVRPALRKMQGHTDLDRPVATATLAHDVRKKQDRRYYLRARLTADPGGSGLAVELAGSQSSALLTAAHRGNCLMVLPQGEGSFPAGTEVECMRLDITEGVLT
jgi:molybdopterin molybdotransferase